MRNKYSVSAFLMLICLMISGSLKAEEITVANGTSKNDRVPIYGQYADNAQKCEFLIPSSELTEVKDGIISALKFYSDNGPKVWESKFTVFIKEINASSLTSFVGPDGADIVFEGNSLEVTSSKEMSINFTQPYTYKGGNLLVGIYKENGKNYLKMSFYGKNQDNVTALVGNSSSGNVSSVSKYYYFIPKTTITYTKGASQPDLQVLDFVSGSIFDFGGQPVAAGTVKTFTLQNKGTSPLSIDKIGVTNYDIISGSDLKEIAPLSSGEISIATPACDSEGILKIESNDPNSPYVIYLKSQYKQPAPIMNVNLTDINFGKVKENVSQEVILNNSGDADLIATIESDNSSFTISSKVLTVLPGQNGSFIVNFNYNPTDYGTHKANLTITPNVGEPQIVTVVAKIMDPTIWTEEFDNDGLPEGWKIEGDKWQIDNGRAKAEYAYGVTSYLSTPDLTVGAGEELNFQYRTTGIYVSIIVQYSKNGGEYKELLKIEEGSKMADFKSYIISDLQPGSYRFRFLNDNYELDNFEGFRLDKNAPRLQLDPIENASFGKVYSEPEPKTYTVTNIGTGNLALNLYSENENFRVEPAMLTDIASGESKIFKVYFNYDIDDLGEKKSYICLIPTYNDDIKIEFQASAIAKTPYVWDEDFEDGIMPEGWTTTGWTVSNSKFYGNNGTYMAFAGSINNDAVLITPRLYARKGQDLKFDIGEGSDNETPLTVEYSHDMENWQAIEGSPLTPGEPTTIVFQSPEDGLYYLKFKGLYGSVDNFVGFRRALREHDIDILSETIPVEGNQYIDYSASVKVKEMMGHTEEVTATLFIGEDRVASKNLTLQANGVATIMLSFLPELPILGQKAYIEITGETLEPLKTKIVDVTIIEAPVWNEDDFSGQLEEGRLPVVIFKYSKKPGWNSICVPFELNEDLLETIFGENYELYAFKEYAKNENILKYQITETIEAGQPYIVRYIDDTIADSSVINDDNLEGDDGIILKDIFVKATEPRSISNQGVTFYGNFMPKEAEESEKLYVMHDIESRIYEIAPGKTIKGFRAFLQFNEPLDKIPVIQFYDENGIFTGISVMEKDDERQPLIYDLNGIMQNRNSSSGLYIVNGKKIMIKTSF